MSLADGTTAGPLITGYSRDRDVRQSAQIMVKLSKPLARAVPKGETLRVAILRYPPFYAVGTAQFDLTAAGWLRYVALVTDLVEKTYGSGEFDVEIWNELTFGSAFLDIGNYYEPKAERNAAEFLHRGGSAWELASRTVWLLKRRHPQVNVIWGFSNTTFFHVPISELPPQLDGQSYHPYGTGRRCYADLIRGRRELLLDSFVPTGCVVQPEGYAHAWQQTESLLRFVAPEARTAHPSGSTTFQHFITEHGFSPAEIGIAEPHEAERAKKGFLLRAPLLWLNKGLSALYVYDLYEPDDAGFGLFRSDGSISSGLSALHRLTSEFAGPETLTPRQLSLDVKREGRRTGVLPGDPDGAHLLQEQAAAFLPFQVNATRFVLGAYVMTQDFPNALIPQPYRVTIGGVDGRHATVKYFSPDTDTILPARVIAATEKTITLQLAITEVPSLIEIEETRDPRGNGEI
jgi:hypothetical protein